MYNKLRFKSKNVVFLLLSVGGLRLFQYYRHLPSVAKEVGLAQLCASQQSPNYKNKNTKK